MGDFTYEPSTDAGYVRLLIGDTHVDEPSKQIFTDAEIDQFLSREGNNVKLAAAAAAEAIAASTARSAIAWRAMGRDVDKTKIPDAYQKAADRWRKQAQTENPAEEIDQMAFEYGDFGQDRSERVGDDFFGVQ